MRIPDNAHRLLRSVYHSVKSWLDDTGQQSKGDFVHFNTLLINNDRGRRHRCVQFISTTIQPCGIIFCALLAWLNNWLQYFLSLYLELFRSPFPYKAVLVFLFPEIKFFLVICSVSEISIWYSKISVASEPKSKFVARICKRILTTIYITRYYIGVNAYYT